MPGRVMLALVCAAAFVLVGSSVISAQPNESSGTHPDFSGHWGLDPKASRLQVPMPDDALIVIEQREPSFKLTRTFIRGAKEETVTLGLSTDGRETSFESNGEKTTARLHWDGAALVLESTIVQKDGRTGTNVVRYELSPDGQTLTAHEKFTGPKKKYENTWVMRRIP